MQADNEDREKLARRRRQRHHSISLRALRQNRAGAINPPKSRPEGEEMNPMVGKPWAPEEDRRLRALASSGASVAEMAKQLKRSEEAVRSRAYRLKIVLAKSRKLRLKAKGK
jgi:hypothetical protein